MVFQRTQRVGLRARAAQNVAERTSVGFQQAQLRASQ